MSVDVTTSRRYAPGAEAAVYFCCLEAMQNAGKHAGADASVTVHVGENGGGLEFEVSDDGAGFDLVTVGESHGFVNMRDRLGALAGVHTRDQRVGGASAAAHQGGVAHALQRESPNRIALVLRGLRIQTPAEHDDGEGGDQREDVRAHDETSGSRAGAGAGVALCSRSCSSRSS